MPRPRVTLHNLTSLDGRLDGFTPDVGLYYETAARLPQQAVLTGSGTLLAAAAAEGIDLSGADAARGDGPPPTDASLPWLVVVDSAGRVSRLDWLRGRPFWRDVLVLCCCCDEPSAGRPNDKPSADSCAAEDVGVADDAVDVD